MKHRLARLLIEHPGGMLAAAALLAVAVGVTLRDFGLAVGAGAAVVTVWAARLTYVSARDAQRTHALIESAEQAAKEGSGAAQVAARAAAGAEAVAMLMILQPIRLAIERLTSIEWVAERPESKDLDRQRLDDGRKRALEDLRAAVSMVNLDDLPHTKRLTWSAFPVVDIKVRAGEKFLDDPDPWGTYREDLRQAEAEIKALIQPYLRRFPLRR